MTNSITPTIQATKNRVIAAVWEIGDPLLKHIEERVGAGDATRVAVRELVQEGMLRMKDDSFDHAWAYRMTSKGRATYGYGEQT